MFSPLKGDAACSHLHRNKVSFQSSETQTEPETVQISETPNICSRNPMLYKTVTSKQNLHFKLSQNDIMLFLCVQIVLLCRKGCAGRVGGAEEDALPGAASRLPSPTCSSATTSTQSSRSRRFNDHPRQPTAPGRIDLWIKTTRSVIIITPELQGLND